MGLVPCYLREWFFIENKESKMKICLAATVLMMALMNPAGGFAVEPEMHYQCPVHEDGTMDCGPYSLGMTGDEVMQDPCTQKSIVKIIGTMLGEAYEGVREQNSQCNDGMVIIWASKDGGTSSINPHKIKIRCKGGNVYKMELTPYTGEKKHGCITSTKMGINGEEGTGLVLRSKLCKAIGYNDWKPNEGCTDKNSDD